jgi:hypothetical protein
VKRPSLREEARAYSTEYRRRAKWDEDNRADWKKSLAKHIGNMGVDDVFESFHRGYVDRKMRACDFMSEARTWSELRDQENAYSYAQDLDALLLFLQVLSHGSQTKDNNEPLTAKEREVVALLTKHFEVELERVKSGKHLDYGGISAPPRMRQSSEKPTDGT